MKRHANLLLRLGGLLVFAASFYYLGDRLVANLDAVSVLALSWSTWGMVITTGLVYGAALSLPALVWGSLVTDTRGKRPSWQQIMRVYGRAQILKYAPSNVLQFAGRQLLGARQGWSQKAIAAASVLEVSLFTSAAGLLVLLFGGAWITEFAPWASRFWLFLLLLALIVGMWLMLNLVPRLPGLRSNPAWHRLREVAPGLKLPLMLVPLLAFFLICGILVWIMVGVIDRAWHWQLLPEICAGYTAAWLIGFVSPGVSAGLGIREAAFLVLLGPGLGEPTAVAVALAMRLVSILGDLLFFAAAQGLESYGVASSNSKPAAAPPGRRSSGGPT
jgi:vacuolar-type H+-ATPase subunit I/STV1